MESLAYGQAWLMYEGDRDIELAFNPRLLGIIPTVLAVVLLIPAPATAQLLEKGERGPQVTTVQNQLKDLGYFPDSVRSTGYYGPITKQSVMEFQAANGLRVDGIAGPRTKAALQAVYTPQPIVTPVVDVQTPTYTTKEVQDKLKVLGYFPDSVRSTGYYGPITKQSVREFQAANGLAVDGVIGPKTAAALKAVDAPTPASGTNVVALQNQLKDLGYFPKGVRSTGYYGPITKQSVREFQAANGLRVDGVAGPSTMAALDRKVAFDPGGGGSQPQPQPQPKNLLAQGSEGEAVARAKERLNQFGYSTGEGDTYDEQTVAAVKRFQADKGLPVDGVIGPNTRTFLYVNEGGLPVVRQGDTGNVVELVQYQLGMVPTGEFDDATLNAVKAFQEEQGLTVDGVVGPKTHQALGTHRGQLSKLEPVNETEGQ